MRGEEKRLDGMFSYVRLEERVAKDHPLRPIRDLVEAVLGEMGGRFATLYSHTGRPSIPPEQLLKALLLQAFFSVRSERQLMEQINYNLLFRWFVGLSMDASVWDATTFTKNRDRLLAGDVAREFLAAVLSQPWVKRLLSNDHFSVDGTLIEAWASMKSVRPKGDGPPSSRGDNGGRNAEVNFKGERRTNETHGSTTDPSAKLYKKSPGAGAKLCFMGHALMENRSGLILDAMLTPVDGHAERAAALIIVEPLADRPSRVTLGADKGYDASDFVNELRSMRSARGNARSSF
jgi:transposase